MSTEQNKATRNTIMITGATSGIGEEAAKELARMGEKVIVVSRNLKRCQNTVDNIKAVSANPYVDYMVADLSSQKQIHQLVEEFKNRYDRLDVLINNAGGFYLFRQESEDGLEMTFALNHLNYFLLTNQLLEMILASAPARIINVASNSHYNEELDFDDLQMNRLYLGWRAYGRSKLANVLFTYELSRRLQGSNVTVNAVHPGFVATNIGKNNGWLARLFVDLWHRTALPVDKGAETVIYLATSNDVEGVSGKYFVKKKAVKSDQVSYDED
ncbi:MAG: SDR family oxidoreductase, partial [Anaerolineales bacterium]